ncbi:hypothetical protein G8V07_14660 [Clostridium botulinum D/C]|uniref:hypothetical protein n=1 Tax=Clostridium botulinum TaxID=1491 RepID=UPI001E389A38|nr:hypothetical protein [Clostridium botulinum]MCD3321684.1 hypothetical protein [Clostridium botulinum D/C]MCD3324965.1 hypothetical protein [Clostridium botulinum D/C]MCD3327743.1 hypothetical protein [Clostridium botulinum D/C]
MIAIKIKMTEKRYDNCKMYNFLICRYKNVALMKKYNSKERYLKDIENCVKELTTRIADVIMGFIGIVCSPIILLVTLLNFVPRVFIIKGGGEDK